MKISARLKTLSLSALIAASVLGTARPAPAAILLGARFSPAGVAGASLQLGLCLVLLPLCVLGEKDDGSAPVSAQALADNGYSPREVAHILRDQDRVAQALVQRQARLTVLSTDSAATLEQDLRSLVPDVSNDYVTFLQSSLQLTR